MKPQCHAQRSLRCSARVQGCEVGALSLVEDRTRHDLRTTVFADFPDARRAIAGQFDFAQCHVARDSPRSNRRRASCSSRLT
jgi:hypothetical protein